MPYQPRERLLSKAEGSVYKLVILASQRALELSEGMPTFVEKRRSDKPTVLSLDEIAGDKVGLRLAPAKAKPKVKEAEKPKAKEAEKPKAKEAEKPKAKPKAKEKAKKKSK